MGSVYSLGLCIIPLLIHYTAHPSRPLTVLLPIAGVLGKHYNLSGCIMLKLFDLYVVREWRHCNFTFNFCAFLEVMGICIKCVLTEPLTLIN